MPVETFSIQFTTTLWFDDVPGKFLDLVVARRLLLSSSGIRVRVVVRSAEELQLRWRSTLTDRLPLPTVFANTI